MSAEATLTKQIQEYEQLHSVQFNQWQKDGQTVNGRDILERFILSKYQELKGGWRRKTTGERVDLDDIIKWELAQKHEGRSLVKNSGVVGKYVSPYSPRTPQQLAEHTQAMSRFIQDHIKEQGLVFLSADIEKKFTENVASNFIAVDSEDGPPKFHKVTGGGVVSPTGWTFEELGGELRIERLIDNDRSFLQKGLIDASLKEEAIRISGTTAGHDFERVISKLRKVNKPMAGKTAKIDKLTLHHEFEKETKIELNINEFSTMEDIRKASAIAKQKMDKLNSLDDIKPMINAIEQPQPVLWDI